MGGQQRNSMLMALTPNGTKKHSLLGLLFGIVVNVPSDSYPAFLQSNILHNDKLALQHPRKIDQCQHQQKTA